jgi:hypothetical protein
LDDAVLAHEAHGDHFRLSHGCTPASAHSLVAPCLRPARPS